jgi:uncharacterized membrane protein YjjB (DUF3815 family)
MIVVPGLLQLAPGFLGTEVVLRLLCGSAGAAGTGYSSVFLVSLEITLGLLLSAAIKMTTRAVRSDAQ